MKLDFIEIGTSDFRTLADGTDLNGISVEPVKEYFDRLPDRDGLIKLNMAVYDMADVGVMYYFPRKVIDAVKLPLWFAGCHSLGKPHQPCVDWLNNNGLDWRDIIHRQETEITTLGRIFDTYAITEVDFLKIDTEGCDVIIMSDLFRLMRLGKAPIIKRIKYESNLLMSKEDSAGLRLLAVANGYEWTTVVERGNEDTILNLKA